MVESTSEKQVEQQIDSAVVDKNGEGETQVAISDVMIIDPQDPFDKEKFEAMKDVSICFLRHFHESVRTDQLADAFLRKKSSVFLS